MNLTTKEPGFYFNPYYYPGAVEVRDHLPLTDITIRAKLLDIQDVVCRYTLVTAEQIKGRARPREITDARFMFWTLARKYTSATLVQVGAESGNKDHSTILHGIRTLDDLMRQRQNVALRNTYDNCERHLRLYFADVKKS